MKHVSAKKASPDSAHSVIKRVALQTKKKADQVVETQQIVTFSLDKEEYAAIISDLREIIRIPDVVAIPGAPGYIRGILNLRGQLVVVIDLERRVGLERDHKDIQPKHIIIVDIGDTIFGIVVDEVSGVLRVPVTSIRQTPGLIASKIHTDFLKGVVILEEIDTGEDKKAVSQKKAVKASPKKAEDTEETDEGKEEKEGEKEQYPESAEELVSPKKDVVTVDEESELPQASSRLILLLDLPKLLSEKELLEFGKAVEEATDLPQESET